MIIKEAELRKAIQDQLSDLVEKARLVSEKKKMDVDVDPGDIKGLSKPIAKLLQPGLSPQKFAALDQAVDERGKPRQQAQALLGFALSYVENNTEEAEKLLKLAIRQLGQVESPGEKK